MIGNNACGSRALGYGRTADNVAGLTVAFGTGEVATVGAGRAAGRPRARPWSTSSTRTSAHVRTSFGRFSRQVSGYSLEHLLPERGRRLDRFLVGCEGTLGRAPRGHRASSSRRRPRGGCWCSATRRWPRPPTPSRRCWPPRAAATGAWSPARGWTPGSSTWCAAPGGAVPELPRGAGWLFVEVTAASAAACAAGAAGLTAAAGALGHRLVDDPAETAALWRIRERRRRPGRPQPGPAGPLRLGGRRRPARAPRRLAARLRRAADRARPRTACPTATSATAASTSRIDFTFDEPRAPRLPRLPGGLGDGAAGLRRLDLRASTATAAPARSCCR